MSIYSWSPSLLSWYPSGNYGNNTSLLSHHTVARVDYTLLAHLPAGNLERHQCVAAQVCGFDGCRKYATAPRANVTRDERVWFRQKIKLRTTPPSLSLAMFHFFRMRSVKQKVASGCWVRPFSVCLPLTFPAICVKIPAPALTADVVRCASWHPLPVFGPYRERELSVRDIQQHLWFTSAHFFPPTLRAAELQSCI